MVLRPRWELTFYVGDTRLDLTAGGFAFGPKGVPHTFIGAGPGPRGRWWASHRCSSKDSCGSRSSRALARAAAAARRSASPDSRGSRRSPSATGASSSVLRTAARTIAPEPSRRATARVCCQTVARTGPVDRDLFRQGGASENPIFRQSRRSRVLRQRTEGGADGGERGGKRGTKDRQAGDPAKWLWKISMPL